MPVLAAQYLDSLMIARMHVNVLFTTRWLVVVFLVFKYANPGAESVTITCTTITLESKQNLSTAC